MTGLLIYKNNCMISQPEELSSVVIRFGDAPERTRPILSFKSTIGKNKTANIRSELSNSAKRLFGDSSLVVVFKMKGDTAKFQQYLVQYAETNQLQLSIHKQGDNLFVEVPLPEIRASLEEFNLKDIMDDGQDFLSGFLSIDKDADLSRATDMIKNSQLALRFRNTPAFSTVLKRIIGLVSPSNLSMIDIFKQFNLEVNCNSSQTLPASLQEYFNLYLMSSLELDVSGLQEKCKAYYTIDQLCTVEIQMDSHRIGRALEIIVSSMK